MATPVAYQPAYLLGNRLCDREKMYMVNKQNEECYINMRRATMRANGEGKLYYVLRREIRLEWLTMTHAQKSIWLASTKQTQLIDQVAEDKPWMLGGYPTANIKSALRKELETAPAACSLSTAAG